MERKNSSENIIFLLNEENDTIEIQQDVTIQDLLDEFGLNSNDNIWNDTNTNTNTNTKQISSLLYQSNVNEYSYSGKSFEESTLADLFKICDYYELTKYVKMAKYKKNEIIHAILIFESDKLNYEIVERRYKMWEYISELSKDKMMKKYIIWK